jgi:fluoride ion exporter CrcB/FEX
MKIVLESAELVSLMNNDVLLPLAIVVLIMGTFCAVYIGVKMWRDK